MIREQFIGKNPSHFQVNPFVKAFIVSEGMVWSAYNFIIPIIAIFVVKNISGGTIEIVAFAFSSYLISRVFAELITSRYLNGVGDKFKLKFIFSGLILLSISYVVFSLLNSIEQLFLAYILSGIGMGMTAPAKYSLFSTHLDKGKEPAEWSMYDAFTFIGMALATSLGGFIAAQYGFPILFIMAAVINTLGIIPYLLYIR